MFETVDPEAVKRKLKFDYMRSKSEPVARHLEGFISLLQSLQNPNLKVLEFAQEITAHIQRTYRLRWVMIGIRNPADGVYRYEVHTGMRDEAWKRQQAKVYSREDFENSPRYSFGEISKLSRIYMEEDNPLFNEDQYVVNRPALLRAKRETLEDSLEADFIDTLVLGPNDDLMAWIEYSGTTTGKLPDPMTIRYIEVIANILAAVMVAKGYSKAV